MYNRGFEKYCDMAKAKAALMFRTDISLGLGFRSLGLRSLGFRGLGLKGLGLKGLGFKGLGFRDLLSLLTSNQQEWSLCSPESP